MNDITNFIKKYFHVNCLQDYVVMYNAKLIILELEVIPPIPDAMIPVDFCQNIEPENFTTNDMK